MKFLYKTQARLIRVELTLSCKAAVLVALFVISKMLFEQTLLL